MVYGRGCPPADYGSVLTASRCYTGWTSTCGRVKSTRWSERMVLERAQSSTYSAGVYNPMGARSNWTACRLSFEILSRLGEQESRLLHRNSRWFRLSPSSRMSSWASSLRNLASFVGATRGDE